MVYSDWGPMLTMHFSKHDINQLHTTATLYLSCAASQVICDGREESTSSFPDSSIYTVHTAKSEEENLEVIMFYGYEILLLSLGYCILIKLLFERI